MTRLVTQHNGSMRRWPNHTQEPAIRPEAKLDGQCQDAGQPGEAEGAPAAARGPLALPLPLWPRPVRGVRVTPQSAGIPFMKSLSFL